MQPISATIADPTPLTDVLTWDAICALYPKEWVILVDLVDEGGPNITAGRVYAHSPDKRTLREVGREASIRYGSMARFFTGPFPQRVFVEEFPAF